MCIAVKTSTRGVVSGPIYGDVLSNTLYAFFFLWQECKTVCKSENREAHEMFFLFKKYS
jgi:hypothetical protein